MTGTVSTSSVSDTTIEDAGVIDCLARAAKRWRFPRPRDGGVAIVSLPLELVPG